MKEETKQVEVYFKRSKEVIVHKKYLLCTLRKKQTKTKRKQNKNKKNK